ncbi:MAG: hypothetical protein EA387_04175 [Nitriliruptor sp.]|nr:MAG: hypothetical protein EA387_04175 [Nitriliruptor sp.]
MTEAEAERELVRLTLPGSTAFQDEIREVVERHFPNFRFGARLGTVEYRIGGADAARVQRDHDEWLVQNEADERRILAELDAQEARA